jgi:hypothetical protein
MDSGYSDIVNKRKDRAIAIILGVKEKEADGSLTPEVRQVLRKVVLDQINDLSEFTIDIIKSLDNGDVINEHYFQRLEEKIDSLMEMHGHRF